MTASICIATPDYCGPIRNGGVGTAFKGLAELLIEADYRVTVLYTTSHYEVGDSASWKTELAKQGMEFIPLDMRSVADVVFPASTTGVSDPIRSYATYRHFCECKYDLIHFPDYLGIGYYSSIASRVKSLSNGPIVTTLHGPTAWSLRSNPAPVANPNLLFREALERGAIEHSKAVISPSRYMLDFVAGMGWSLPDESLVIQNVLPASNLQSSAVNVVPFGAVQDDVKNIVFFGRLEQRKGINLFIDAVNILQERKELCNSFRIVFLGKTNEHAYSMNTLGLRLSKWNVEWCLIEDLNAEEALNYLENTKALAVIPSLSDNLPCTIQECVGRGIPFLAADVGGATELVADRDRSDFFFEPTAWALAERLHRFLNAGHASAARPRVGRSDAKQQHLELTARLIEEHRAISRTSVVVPGSHTGAAVAAQFPEVSVCITHRDRPQGLEAAFRGLANQTMRPKEVIVADDHSAAPDTLEYLEALQYRSDLPFPIHVARSKEARFPSAARNAAARVACGDLLKFHDDDNVSKRHEIETFARGISTGPFDLLTCALDFVASDEDAARGPAYRRFIFLGNGYASSFIFIVLGDTNFAVVRE
jgi:glycosyltransferase involved in cell wall biosynthesis